MSAIYPKCLGTLQFKDTCVNFCNIKGDSASVAIPLLEYSFSTQNQRVSGYEISGEEQPRIYSIDNLLSADAIQELIWAAYRQVFGEHRILSSTRQKYLESQLKFGQISVRDFIRGLVLSDTFRRLNYDTNSNYRFVATCVQRLLGRDVYGEDEKLAWSIVVATQGIQGFVDAVLGSDEYLDSFGDDTVPYQKRRILPSQIAGETPFNLKMPRYDTYHRIQLGFPQSVWQNAVRSFVPQEDRARSGDPSGFMGMAKDLSVIPQLPRVDTTNLDYENLVPRR